jgi:hypothetical protein
MNINPSIFKAYDIRGIYPTDLNEEATYAIGRAFVMAACLTTGWIPCGMRTALSWSAAWWPRARRLTSPSMATATASL